MRVSTNHLGRAVLGGLIACSLAWSLAACSGRRDVASASSDDEPATAQAKRGEGVAIIRQMSEKIAAAPALTFSTTEVAERVRKNGEKVTLHLDRDVAMRRPDRLWFKVTGDHDLEGYYEGKRMTLVSHKQKVWGEFPTPPTIDETVDVISERYDIPMPIGDLLTLNPEASMVSADTTGGLAGRETIDGVSCQMLVWHHPNVDWSVWIPVSGDPLPKKLQITYKARRGQPTTTVMFKDWNLMPELSDDVFARRVPDDYEGISVIQSASSVLPKEPQTKRDAK